MEQSFHLYKMEPQDSLGLVGHLQRDDDVQFPTSFMQTTAYNHWCGIGARHQLHTHLDILCFLIKCYDEMFGQSVCLTCSSPLAVVCVKCLTQSHSAAGNNSRAQKSWHQAAEVDLGKTDCASALTNEQQPLPLHHHQQQQPQEDFTLSGPYIPPSPDVPSHTGYPQSSHIIHAASPVHQSCVVTRISLPSSLPFSSASLSTSAALVQPALTEFPSPANDSSLMPSACEELRLNLCLHPQTPSFPVTSLVTSFPVTSLVTSFPVTSLVPLNSTCAAIPQSVSAQDPGKLKTGQASSVVISPQSSSSVVISPESSSEPTVFGAETAVRCVPGAPHLKRAPQGSTPIKMSVEVQTQTKKSARARVNQTLRKRINTRSRTVKRRGAKTKTVPVKQEPVGGDTDGTQSSNSVPSYGDSDTNASSETDLVHNIRTADLSADVSLGKKHKTIKVEMGAVAESLTPEVREEREKALETLYCAKCNRKYSCRLTLKRHLELSKAHGGPGNIIVPKHRQGEQSRKRPKRSLEEYFDYWWTHGDVDVIDDSVVCKLCVHNTRLFSSKQEWRKHHREHKIRVKKTLCPVCGKEVDNLKIHMLYHRSDKPFKCPYCPAAYVIKQKLRDHIYTHTKEKNFCCEICGKRFSVKARLAAHSLVHSNKKPFRCEQCGDSFARSRGLKDHMRVHTGEKPYACGVCGRKFASSGNLAAHRRKVHRLEPMVGRTAKKLIVID